MRKAGTRIVAKVRQIVQLLHQESVKFICTNFSVILLPNFMSGTMIRCWQLKFRSKTAKASSTWSHHRFRQSLVQKSKEYPWRQVIIANEADTTDACDPCGQINSTLGGRSTFCFSQSKMLCGRDVDGACNILLRFLSE